MIKLKNPFAFLIVILIFAFCILPSSVGAITPNGVRQMPNVIYEMLDCSNLDFGQTHPEWGPVGGWRGFGNSPGCTGGNAQNYIQAAKNMTVTLTDGTRIPKPVGVGWRATTENINNWTFLNDPQYSNLAFIVAESPSIYGEVTSSYTLADGVTQVEDTLPWAKIVMGPLSRAFPTIPIFFQSCGYASELLYEAQTKNYPNIGVKCNGWYLDSDNAMSYYSQSQYSSTPCRLADGILNGGAFGFASASYQTNLVGFEPKHGHSVEQWYWGIMQALSHHPDMVDVDTPDITKFSLFGQQYGFNLINFLSTHLGKTLTNTPNLWLVLRETQVSRVRECGSDNGTSPEGCDCCWRFSSSGTWVCVGPQRGNFSFWLYQKDNLAGGRTEVVNHQNLPEPAKSHPYGLYTSRRTNQTGGQNFIYLDVDNNFRPSPPQGMNLGWEVTATFVNQGSDKISIEYINKSGQTIKQSISKGATLGVVSNWVDYKWTLTDADFSANRMNGADFRINSENDGDETVHRVIVNPVYITPPSTPSSPPTHPTPTPGNWRTPTPTSTGGRNPTAVPSPTPGLYFYPGWQMVQLNNNTVVPNNCQVIVYKENNLWQNFLGYLKNLLFAPRKQKVWVKCS